MSDSLVMEAFGQPVIQTLAELIRINSVNPNYADGVPEVAIADYVQQYFVSLGIETWRQWVYPDRPNVIARIPGHHPHRRIVLEAHLDTVSTQGMTIAPWSPEIRDGRMYGRGACDTKGGMAAMMQAMACLVGQGITPPCDVLFLATIDEEFSYRGVVAVCDSLAPGPVAACVLRPDSLPRTPLRAEAAIIAEPTSLLPVVASKGVLRWKIETRGKAAHSAKPHLGVNAIQHMAHVISHIEQDAKRLAEHVHPLLGPATCTIGVIRGGVQVNSVPEHCEIQLDRRLLPGETCQDVLAHYQMLLDFVAAKYGVDAIMQPPMLTDKPLETNPSSPAVRTMIGILTDMGLDATLTGVPFGSDASKFGALGIPSLILGPGSIDQAHAAIEYIECSQVIQAVEIYRRFLMEFV